MEASLEALLTWPRSSASTACCTSSWRAGIAASSNALRMRWHCRHEPRTCIAAGSFLHPGCDPANWVKRKQNMCFHNIAEQLEGEGQLERAEIWYRRAIACCLEAYDAQKEAQPPPPTLATWR